MSGQGRVAMACGNVPDFDGFVVATTGDKLAVRRKSDGVDTVIGQVSTCNTQAERKNTEKKRTLSSASARSASTCKPHILYFYIFTICLSEKVTISSGLSHGHSQEHNFLVSSF